MTQQEFRQFEIFTAHVERIADALERIAKSFEREGDIFTILREIDLTIDKK